ncbi:hypothetical protein PSI19_21130 [Xenorhabdus khoisanae]|uniref:hypothetical protein n=1 Tax=Xenorhabdus khoisanae TaxID=880157 RepID=UPI0023586818|nr:hypothetical protein [Xenorhabdus khoisanae]MDC9616300.1 hypothetical protein [Xenorhabdus khoisanae]
MSKITEFESPVMINNQTGKDIISFGIKFIHDGHLHENIISEQGNVIKNNKNYIPKHDPIMKVYHNGGGCWWYMTWTIVEKEDEDGKHGLCKTFATDPGPYAGWLDALNQTSDKATDTVKDVTVLALGGTITAKALLVAAGITIPTGAIAVATVATAAAFITSFIINNVTKNKDVKVDGYERHVMPKGSTPTRITIYKDKVEIKTKVKCSSSNSEHGECYSTSTISVSPTQGGHKDK